ncbi:MAG: sensor histidine kinase [Cyanobacteria bacterium P01_E01_bin.48]
MAIAIVNVRQSPVPPIAPGAIPKALRYVEWVFLGLATLRMILPISYADEIYDVGPQDYLVLIVFGCLTLLSFVSFPSLSPWQRRAYIALEIGLLLPTRLFTDWGLDPFLYLYLAKSVFLLSRREAISVAVASGVFWHCAYAWRMPAQLAEVRDRVEEMLQASQHVLILDALINSITVYLIFSISIVLLCLTVVSERQSRYRAAALAREVEVLAADLERSRIARDMHDSLGHTLTSLDVQLELAQRLFERNSDGARQAISISKNLASQSVRDVRRAVATMREEHFDLNAALTHLTENLRDTCNAKIEVKIDLPKLPLQTSHQLYCTLKEGLENIRKHSSATSIYLQGRVTSAGVEIELHDDGIGFDLSRANTGFGLRGMRERAQLMGAQMTVNSEPGRGTSICILLAGAGK